MSLPYHEYFQLLALAMAAINYRYLRLWRLQVMLPLMIFTCTIEILATNMHLLGLTTNWPVYNLYVLISPVMYFILFWNMLLLNKRGKKIYLVIAAISMVFALYDYFFIEGLFDSYSMVLALIQHVVLSFMVLSQLSMEEANENTLLAEPYFWVAAGILLFAVVSVVILGLQPYILKKGIKLFSQNLYRAVMPMVNVVLYSCYSYAFYLCRKHRQRFLPS
jgi:hypothetical protein